LFHWLDLELHDEETALDMVLKDFFQEMPPAPI